MTAQEFDRLFAHLEKLVRKKLDGAFACHDFRHVERVMRNGEKLTALIPEADKRVVRMATLLHDIARPEEIASKGTVCHARHGAEMARKLLIEQGAPEDFANSVAAAVRTHRFRNSDMPETAEAKIVYDADKLDSLGAVGIGRSFLFAGREHAGLHNTKEEALAAEEYSLGDTAYREYLVKLSKLPERMLTEPGRIMAQERGIFMEEFFRRMNEECYT